VAVGLPRHLAAGAGSPRRRSDRDLDLYTGRVLLQLPSAVGLRQDLTDRSYDPLAEAAITGE
jgi:hypothetical protein